MSKTVQFHPCAADLFIEGPVPLRGDERLLALSKRWRTVAGICAQAGVRFRVSGGETPRVVLWSNPKHGYTSDDEGNRVYTVSTLGMPQRSQQRALKILEVLAYGFNDYGTRESVCGRGYFIYPVTPEHGRLWLAEIGKRGGSARSPAKAASSARNGRSRSSARTVR